MYLQEEAERANPVAETFGASDSLSYVLVAFLFGAVLLAAGCRTAKSGLRLRRRSVRRRPSRHVDPEAIEPVVAQAAVAPSFTDAGCAYLLMALSIPLLGIGIGAPLFLLALLLDQHVEPQRHVQRRPDRFLDPRQCRPVQSRRRPRGKEGFDYQVAMIVAPIVIACLAIAPLTPELASGMFVSGTSSSSTLLVEVAAWLFALLTIAFVVLATREHRAPRRRKSVAARC